MSQKAAISNDFYHILNDKLELECHQYDQQQTLRLERNISFLLAAKLQIIPLNLLLSVCPGSCVREELT